VLERSSIKRDILVGVTTLVVGGLLTFAAEWLFSGRQPFESSDAAATTTIIKETLTQQATGPTRTAKEVEADTQPAPSPGTSMDLLEGSTLATFTGHIANDEKCGGPEAAPNSCQLSGVTIGTTSFRAAWWTAGYDTSDSITFNLGGRFRRFTGTLGIVSVSGGGCAEHVEVKGDSRELFGETLAGAHHVNLDVSGIDIVNVSAIVVDQGEGDCQAGLGEPTGVT
jgi:hypothetical protein